MPIPYYVTGQSDNGRTGWNPNEQVLSVASVAGGSFARLYDQAIDGVVYAQPLYFAGLVIPGMGTHNVVIVATETNNVYLFDADKSGPTLQHRLVVPPGEAAVDANDLPGTNISPTVGISSTPVIDPGSQTLYLVAMSRETGGARRFHYRLYALNLATLADKFGGPVEVRASFPHSNDFIPQAHLSRPGLLLLNGVLYIAFGSVGDQHTGEYHGWILAYDATTLQQKAV